jgi:hypothetical protein
MTEKFLTADKSPRAPFTFNTPHFASSENRFPLLRVLRSLLLALILLSIPTPSSSQVRITVAFGPPALPVYEQPLCPGDGYIWTPGYWAWEPDDEDYYWVPGTWVLAPEVGFLWTPPYWAWENGAYVFYDGYWGPHVGFYGGVVYGFGYFGYGFVGGRWDNRRFFYNRSVTNINIVNIHNVYEQRVENVTINHISYNGGPGGISARPRREDEIAARDRHISPAPVQRQHFEAARANRELRASANHGRPPVAATFRPGDFHERAVPAREAGAPYNPPPNRGRNRPAGKGRAGPAAHPKDLPPVERPGPPNTGNANRDRKYQQQQEKLFSRQEHERQKLDQQQEREHQRLAKQNANEARRQQVEQRHQQQTEQLQQRHQQQQQRLQEKTTPKKHR